MKPKVSALKLDLVTGGISPNRAKLSFVAEGVSKIEELDEASQRSDKKNSVKPGIKEAPIRGSRQGTATFATKTKELEEIPVERLPSFQERKSSIGAESPLKSLDLSTDQPNQSNGLAKTSFLPLINAERGSRSVSHQKTISPTKSVVNGSFTVPNKALNRMNVSMDSSSRHSDTSSVISNVTKAVGRFSNLISNKETKLTKALALVRKNLFDKVHKANFNGVIKTFIELIQIAIDEDSMKLFLIGLEQMGDAYFFFKKNEDAFIIYNQLRLAAEYSGDYVKKCGSLMKIAECCKNLTLYEPALKFLKKSLQYAWDTCKEGREIKIYDAMGSVHFHLGDIQRAAAYHDKSVKGSLEPFTSPTRDIYRMGLESHKARFIKTNHVDNSFLAKLSLPFQIRNARPSNVNQMKSSMFAQSVPPQESLGSERSDDNSSRNNNNGMSEIPFEGIEKKRNREDFKPSLKLQIELILKEAEFEMELPSPRENAATNHTFTMDSKALRLFEVKKEHAIKLLQKKPALPKIELKKTLDQKIEELMKFEFDLNKVLIEIQKSAKKSSFNAGLNEALVLNHLKLQKNSQDMSMLFQKCFKNFEKAYKKFLKHISKGKKNY